MAYLFVSGHQYPLSFMFYNFVDISDTCWVIVVAVMVEMLTWSYDYDTGPDYPLYSSCTCPTTRNQPHFIDLKWSVVFCSPSTSEQQVLPE